MADPTPTANQQHPGPLWTIGWGDGSIPQEIEPVFPANGEPYDVWTVRFTTRNGARGHVRIKASQYTAAEVASRIEPVAEELEKTHQMPHTGQHGY